MAEPQRESSRPQARTLPEALVRTLRHEVGDFLQKVYASVAILKVRLAAATDVEQGVLDRLRSGAEECKQVLDVAHDFICPLSLDENPVDLASLAAGLVAAARSRFPRLQLQAESAGPAPITADAQRVAQVGEALLANACGLARSRVTFRTVARLDQGEVEWVVTDDGPGVSGEQAEQFFTPFFATHPARIGLGLALARRLVLLHGGRIIAANLPAEGFEVCATFPVEMARPAAGARIAD